MKKSSLFLILIFSIIHFLSCKKELTYSCDEKLNNFIVENMSAWEGITLDSINTYGTDTQKAIFRAISDSNKVMLWQEKINLISTTVTEPDLLLLLDSLYGMITTAIYQDSIASNNINNYVQSELEATINNDTIAYYYFYTLTNVTYAAFVNHHFSIVTSPGEPAGATATCKCTDTQIAIKDCLIIDECVDGSCNQTSWGCGRFYLEKCTGLCVQK